MLIKIVKRIPLIMVFQLKKNEKFKIHPTGRTIFFGKEKNLLSIALNPAG